jgi:DNA-binding CsgD family transcriptional regulator
MATQSMLRAALATVEAADAAENLTVLPHLLLPALMGAVGAESALWTELDLTAGFLPRRIVCHPEPFLDAEHAATLERHVQDFPLTRHTRPAGPGTPARRSDLQSMASFRGSAMYADVVRKLGIDEMVAMALTQGSLHVCVVLNRAGQDFSAAEVDLLAQLRPLLTRRLARLASGPASGLAWGLATFREDGAAAWPARLPWPGAVPAGAVPGEAVPGEAVPGEAVPAGAVPGEAVLAGAAPGVPGGVPKGRKAGVARAGRDVLTVRQRQVLSLVADGLTDVAIAHRLGCSPRTVDKHLEHVYRKLGVSCRTAAIAAVSGTS